MGINGPNQKNPLDSGSLFHHRKHMRERRRSDPSGASTPRKVPTLHEAESPWQSDRRNRRSHTNVTQAGPAEHPDPHNMQSRATIADERSDVMSTHAIAQPQDEYTPYGDAEGVNRALRDNLENIVTPGGESNHGAAHNLIQLSKRFLEKGHPLIPPLFDAAHALFSRGAARNARADRSLGIKLLLCINPFLPTAFPAVHETASLVRTYVENAVDHMERQGKKPYRGIAMQMLAEHRNIPGVPPTLLARLEEHARQRAEHNYEMRARDIIETMRAYEGLIPSLMPDDPEVYAGMQSFNAISERTTNVDIGLGAFVLVGALASKSEEKPPPRGSGGGGGRSARRVTSGKTRTKKSPPRLNTTRSARASCRHYSASALSARLMILR